MPRAQGAFSQTSVQVYRGREIPTSSTTSYTCGCRRGSLSGVVLLTQVLTEVWPVGGSEEDGSKSPPCVISLILHWLFAFAPFPMM